MKEWLSQYGYLVGILVLVVIVFLVVLNFAAKAYSKHMKSYKAEEAEIKRLKELKEKFKDFDENTIKNSHDDEILEGVALTYQLYLQKIDNIEEAFLKFTEAQQYIYVLDIFVNDGGVKAFFKENTEILRERIVPALKLIGLTAESEKVNRIRRMYDNNDLEASLNEKVIDETDRSLTESDILGKIKRSAAEYIKENVSELKNYR